VTNQLAHRGNVQPNLLKAAARQNAEAIAKLVAERAALVTTQNSLSSQITAAEKEIAALDAESPRWSEDRHRHDVADQAGADKATLTAAIARANTELTTLQGQKHDAGQPDHAAADAADRRAERAGRPQDQKAAPSQPGDQGGRAGRRQDPPGQRDRGGDHGAEQGQRPGGRDRDGDAGAGRLVAQGDAAQALVDAAEKKLADARAALPGWRRRPDRRHQRRGRHCRGRQGPRRTSAWPSRA
jgi:hypothetical protein